MHRLLILFAALTLVFTACDKEDRPDINWGQGGSVKPTPTPVPDPLPTPGSQTDRAASRLEMPALTDNPGEVFIVHRVAPSGGDKDSIVNYAVAYDGRRFHSRWVAFRFDAQTRPKRVSRKPYSARPQYPRDPRLSERLALPSDYSFRGYDHGHLVASADRLFSREANDQTFYMTNMSPQIGQFNQSYWSALEKLVQDLGRSTSFADTLYVVKGGTVADERGVLKYITGYNIPVPAHYYMALLKVKNGVYSSIAFWLEHKNYGRNGTQADMAKHAVSVHRLELNTGIDFFHNLPDVVERRVENSYTLSAWGL